MKRTVFGILTLIFGAFMFSVAAALFSVSAHEDDKNAYSAGIVTEAEKVENKIYEGDYYLNGDKEKTSLSLTDDVIVFPDGTAEEYTFSVWKNMPETDEKSGYINYVDYCFLKTGDDKMRYNPAAKEIILDDAIYKMAE